MAEPGCVSAPGKMMIAGEYAVLEGAEAVVAAVDRRAYLSLQADEGPHVPDEARAARAAAEDRLGHKVSGEILLDVRALRSAGRPGGADGADGGGGESKKLGLGSSAAAAAAAAGYVFASAGHDLAALDTRRAVLEAAFDGHRAVAPRGSGADVAASVMGGYIRFRRDGDRISADPLHWPTALRTAVVWTETEVRTSDMLQAVDQLRSSRPDTYRDCYRRLFEAGEALVGAIGAADSAGVVAGMAGYGEAMGALGEAAGVSIVTDTLRDIHRLAAQHGGAAKPSGAGGGDVAIAVFENSACRDQFLSACGEHRLTVLSLELGACGLRAEARRSADV